MCTGGSFQYNSDFVLYHMFSFPLYTFLYESLPLKL